MPRPGASGAAMKPFAIGGRSSPARGTSRGRRRARPPGRARWARPSRDAPTRSAAPARCSRAAPPAARGLRHRRDLLRLADAAAPPDVEHRDRRSPALEAARGSHQRVASVSLAVVQTRVDWRKRRSASKFAMPDRVLVPVGIEGSSARAILIAAGRFHSPCSSTWMSILSPTALRIFPNGSSAFLRSAAEMSVPPVASAGDRTARSSCRCSPRRQALGELVGAVQEGLQVLVGPLGSCPGPSSSCSAVRLRAHVAVAGAGVVDADAVAALAAEQLVERLPGRLAQMSQSAMSTAEAPRISAPVDL